MSLSEEEDRVAKLLTSVQESNERITALVLKIEEHIDKLDRSHDAMEVKLKSLKELQSAPTNQP